MFITIWARRRNKIHYSAEYEQILSVYQVRTVQRISPTSPWGMATIAGAHIWINSFCYLSKTQGNFTPSCLFKFHIITHSFWSISCYCGLKESDNRRVSSVCDGISNLKEDRKTRLRLLGGHVLPLPSSGENPVLPHQQHHCLLFRSPQ